MTERTQRIRKLDNQSHLEQELSETACVPPPKRIWFGFTVRIRTRNPDYLLNLTGLSLSKNTSVMKIFMKIRSLFPDNEI